MLDVLTDLVASLERTRAVPARHPRSAAADVAVPARRSHRRRSRSADLVGRRFGRDGRARAASIHAVVADAAPGRSPGLDEVRLKADTTIGPTQCPASADPDAPAGQTAALCAQRSRRRRGAHPRRDGGAHAVRTRHARPRHGARGVVRHRRCVRPRSGRTADGVATMSIRHAFDEDPVSRGASRVLPQLRVGDRGAGRARTSRASRRRRAGVDGRPGARRATLARRIQASRTDSRRRSTTSPGSGWRASCAARRTTSAFMTRRSRPSARRG